MKRLAVGTEWNRGGDAARASSAQAGAPAPPSGPAPTRIIAVEEHAFPRDVLEAAGLSLGTRVGRRQAELDEMGAERIRMMDAAGIDMQVVSAALGATVQELEPERSLAVSRALNDRLAGMAEAHPGRFRAFASLPMSAPEQAADELARAVEELGHVGAMIHGQTHGVFLDDPSAGPVLEAAQRLGVPIYLHPAAPPAPVKAAYFSGLAPDLAVALSTAGWGWHAECGMHVLRMVVNGVFERFPGLQIIVGHMGENLPFSLIRADEMIAPALPRGSAGIAETVRRHVHLSTCGYHTEPPLLCALAVFGPDRLMFSVDHPFGDSMSATEFLRSAPLTDLDRDKIAHINAEQLLGL